MKSFTAIILSLFLTIQTYSQAKENLSRCQSLLLNEAYAQVIDFTDSLLTGTGKIQLAGPEESHGADLQDKTVQGIIPNIQEARVLYYRGTAFRELSKLDSAMKCFSLAHQLDTGNPGYLKAMGQTLNGLGRIKESTSIYEQMVRMDPSDHKALADLAALYSQSKKYQQSLNLYLSLLQNDSLNYYFLKQAGKCYQKMNWTDSALKYYETAFDQYPGDVFLTQQICNIYLKKKDLDAAVWSIQRGFVYDTNNLDLLKLRGYIWLLSQKYEMAIWDLEKAGTLDSTDVFIQKYLGLSYHEEKRYEEARRALLNAFMLDSNDAETAFFLGSSCRWSRFEEEGVKYYKKSIELRKPDAMDMKNAYLQLAELYKVLHRFNEALESYEMALEYDTSDYTIYFKIGQVYDQNLNQKKTAIHYYKKFLNNGPTNQQLFTQATGSSEGLAQHVKERIDKLKQDLFLEE